MKTKKTTDQGMVDIVTSIKKKSDKKLYIFTIIIIYLTDSLLFGTNSNPIFLQGKRYAIILLVLVLFFTIRFKKNGPMIQVILITLSLVFSAIFSGQFPAAFSYYTMISLVWFAYIFSCEYCIEDFSKSFCKIMRVIAIASLIVWVLSELIISADFIPTITNTVGVKYKFLLLTNVPVIRHLAERNLGPFWEPGAYQVYLTVAIYFTLFVENHKKKWFDVALFTLTILSTLSGAALLPPILLLLAYALEKKNFKSSGAVLLLFLFVLALFATGTFDIIIEKMGGEAETNSITYRQIGVEGAIRGFIKNPVFGSPPAVNEAIKESLAHKYLNDDYASNTNTFFNYLAYYGIFVGGYFWIRAYKFFKNKTSTFLPTIICFIAFIFSTSNENMMASLLVVTLLFLSPGNVEEEKDGLTTIEVFANKKQG